MLSVRSKFMACLERRLGGRVSQIDNETINTFLKEYNSDPYTGITLKQPSWLTANPAYRAGRGQYRIPWMSLDEFYRENPAFKASLDAQDAKRSEAISEKVV